jgi:hypothetical protein
MMWPRRLKDVTLALHLPKKILPLFTEIFLEAVGFEVVDPCEVQSSIRRHDYDLNLIVLNIRTGINTKIPIEEGNLPLLVPQTGS